MSSVAPRSSDANSCGMPSATTTTPAICTIVAMRNPQSSVS
jgi:hypothetical protein